MIRREAIGQHVRCAPAAGFGEQLAVLRSPRPQRTSAGGDCPVASHVGATPAQPLWEVLPCHSAGLNPQARLIRWSCSANILRRSSN
jgi:hypothetical protein